MVKKCGLSGLFSKCFMLCVSEGKAAQIIYNLLILTNMKHDTLHHQSIASF